MFKKALINLKKDIKELKSLGFSKIDIISYYTAAIMIHRISRSMVLALTLFLYYYIGRPIELSIKTGIHFIVLFAVCFLYLFITEKDIENLINRLEEHENED